MSASSPIPRSWRLDEGMESGFSPVIDIGVRWKELPHASTRSRGFIVLPGEGLLTDEFTVEADHQVHLEAMRVIDEVSHDGMELRVGLEVCGEDCFLAELHLGNEQTYSAKQVLSITLAQHAGKRARLYLRCLPGRLADPVADWVAILAFALATSDLMKGVIAHSQYRWRLENESGLFTHVYENEVYGGTVAMQPSNEWPVESIENSSAGSPMQDGKVMHGDLVQEESLALSRLSDALPSPGESAFAFAHRLLALLMPRGTIDFSSRLRNMAKKGGRPRLLSLCSGEARIENGILRMADIPVDVTLLDLNPVLLQRAAARLPKSANIRLWQGSVEALGQVKDCFDVACFVSGLHHVAALESVLSRIASQLADSGELWIIGEQIGRNGNRLWPDAQRHVDRIFSTLPEHLRYNRNTKSVDARLPDVDYAASCFEGIRSEDITRALVRDFMPLVQEQRNCFLWRMIDLSYIDNYDLANPSDVHILKSLVAAEYAFYSCGGEGCELNGVFRSKLAPGWG